MKYNQLGNSGLVVSQLCLGTMTFGEGEFYGLKFTINQKKADALIAKVLDAGINFFDTADMYAGGQSEIILGKALGKRRKDVIISTKASFRAGEAAFKAGVNYKHLIEQCEQSLKNLNTDYIDLFILHNDDPITPIDETLKALESLINSGKVRYSGFSNYQAWKAATMAQRQKDLNYHPFVAAQMHYSLLSREVESEIVPMSLHHGIGMMVWSPLSSGFLTGKYTRQNPAPKNTRLNTFDLVFYLGLFDRERAYDVVDKVKEIADNHKAKPLQVAIAWLLSKKVVSSVIIGISKMSQLEDNLKSAEIELSSEEIKNLDEFTQPAIKYPNTFIGMQDEILKSAKRN